MISVLGNGDSGKEVKDLQTNLIEAGYSLPKYGVDEEFGDETEGAVRKFQLQQKLLVDGLAGPQTLTKLKEVLSSKQGISYPLPDTTFGLGDEGEGVRNIQRALKSMGIDSTYIDGIYGSLTEAAVRKFQTRFEELDNDGVFGRKTKLILERELN
ncbi:peptidoglycan-binding domain-containing protein [Bacillus sp. 2205SS5-2]|uniref:peptidoglycan-binding domain-containing protein n=1 Tax=Bacillus sp. 2205SS5-2 TaxID=3109031 RepID=UPI00300404A7